MSELDRIENDFLVNHDLPHENTLDELGLELSDLNAQLNAKIRSIDNLFEKALEDGYVDDKEEQELIASSYKVSEEIKDYYEKNISKNGNGLGLLAGVFLFFGAAIGIKQLTR